MALVPYTGEASYLTPPISAPKIGMVQEKSETVTKYKGLSNQGATCYMNSLLQSLFMTPEFRLIMYNWEYDKKKHGKKAYSIPYQLQRLFARLQTGANSYVETRSLAKSFDWDVSQLVEQQDIQEFCAVLFDAVEMSDTEKQLNITQLYEGFVVDSIKCSVCGGGSSHKDRFLNISLPINDPFTKTCNKSLEMALENYLKPEILSGSNAYHCGNCDKKVDASKGMRFEKLPLILAFQLNRFTLNMVTQTRVKINDRVTFPFLLNMNNYMNGYEGIRRKAEECEKELEEELKLFGIDPESEKPVPEKALNGGKPSKMEEKPKLEEVPRVTEPLGKEEEIEGVSGVDLTEEERNNPYLWQTKPKHREILGASEPVFKRDPYEYSVQYAGEKFDTVEAASDLGVHSSVAKEEAKELEDALKKIAQMENEEKIKAFRKRQLEAYLKEGEDVYELFSVNVHLGGAFGGHYYVYIKSFEDGKWYCFNDTSISAATESDIIKTFGEKETAKCAYMLMYRRVGITPPKVGIENLPKYLREEIEQEKIEEEKEEARRKEQLRKMTVTVYYGGQPYMFQLNKDDTLRTLKEKIIEHYDIKTELKNCRLRAFARERRVMLDAYLPEKDNCTLEELNISTFRDYTLEVKSEHEEFVQYTEEDIYVRVVVYSPTFTSLEEEALPAKHLQIKKSNKIKELVEKIAIDLKVPASPERIRVFRRRRGVTYQESSFESIYYEEVMDKMIREMGIYDGSYIYVETVEPEEEIKMAKWIRALEEDKARIHVLFNNPYESTSSDYSAGYENEVVAKKNTTLAELKKIIGEKLNLSTDEFVFKRTGKEGPELKEMDSTLGSLGFIRNSNVYVEFGKPSQPGEYKLLLSEAVMSTNENDDTECHELMEWGDFPILATSTVLQVKGIIAEKLAQDRAWIVSPTRIRLREQSGGKLGKVYLDSMEMKYYGMYDGKPIAFQILEEEEILGPENIVIVVREWNTDNWSMSERKEIVIKTSWRMHDLAYKLCDYFPHYRNQIEQLSGAKVVSLWNFKRGMLIDMTVSFLLKHCEIVGQALRKYEEYRRSATHANS
eukprot:TRINITY_DN71107_c2_g1_i1.p1 TRINITY_DN71107_c2_g1~~TRINITY_DN71107_c2_g1_i1.p1  ORF type:complete len:1068 (+),score=157.18 TRINITY_DN71107_c2_g1_i1:86-3289(+)